jgi:hypothetical protein
MAEPEISQLFKIVDNSFVKSWDKKKANYQPLLCSQAFLSFLLENFQTAKQVELWFLTVECQD